MESKPKTSPELAVALAKLEATHKAKKAKKAAERPQTLEEMFGTEKAEQMRFDAKLQARGTPKDSMPDISK